MSRHKAGRRQAGGRTNKPRGGKSSNRRMFVSSGGVVARPADKGFPIVGLGASAGGLEALEEFFKRMPPDAGMAFVVVTHQHPGHTSLLPELLRKHTRMPVAEASDGAQVEPNRIYISRPDYYVGILGGRLHLMKFKEDGGLRLPIDFFLRALAEDQQERSVGIVLSGSGSDGTLGLKAIKGAGGMAIAQEPASARYAGMPGSAISTGVVDYVLRPDQIPQRLASYAKGAKLAPALAPLASEEALAEPMQKVLFLLRSRTGHDFSLYKPATIRRRIERRINIHQIKGPRQYLQYLLANPHEVDLLFKGLLIRVTSFFRDPDGFHALAQGALATLLKAKPELGTLRVWVAGCSTGEEAYSLAILIRDSLDRLKKRLSLQIFATDLDSDAINIARTGLYPDGIAVDVPQGRLARYFTREDGSYRIKKEIRESVVFASQNVLEDSPFTKLDLLCCRNLLIYLKAEAQKRLLSLFHYALKPDGILFLGPSEGIDDFRGYFTAADKRWKIFTRAGGPLAYPLPAPFGPAPSQATHGYAGELPAPAPPAASLFEKLLAEQFAPASVVINEGGDISYIHGRTGEYLEPASGQPRSNILEMAREGLRLELAAALRRAATRPGPVVLEGVRIKSNGAFTAATVTVSRITRSESLRGLLLVTFRSTPVAQPPAARRARLPAAKPAGRIPELERELAFTRESLQGVVEQLQTSNEELKSANEELQSTNEELQSANEELETSREEMQSLNEELQTVNAELQNKVEALSEANDDQQNLLNSTSVGTIFLDGHLKIRRFTDLARSVINLIPSDLGRPLADLVSKLKYERLVADASEVLRTLQPREREVQTEKGDWRLVRILPYRTRGNVVDGLVVTFIDITRIKVAERQAQRAREFSESIVTTVRQPLLVLDADLHVVSANRAFFRLFRVHRAEVERQSLYQMLGGKWDVPRLRRLLEKILPRKTAFENFEVEQDFPRLGRRVLLLNARRLEQERGQPGLILLAIEDATRLRTPCAGAAGNPGRRSKRVKSR